MEDVIPSLTASDVVVVVLGLGEGLTDDQRAICHQCSLAGAKLGVITVVQDNGSSDEFGDDLIGSEVAVRSTIKLGTVELIPGLATFADFALKMLLNVVTSGMQVPCGYVLHRQTTCVPNFSSSSDTAPPFFLHIFLFLPYADTDECIET